ncbi:hypothetical protein [Ponticoccus litoralis]|uniref:Secreted protein n=1 Tax=Ponticoccus litoralis TaxID=422297 RepID=A0AAW9SCI4_9RHOB
MAALLAAPLMRLAIRAPIAVLAMVDLDLAALDGLSEKGKRRGRAEGGLQPRVVGAGGRGAEGCDQGAGDKDGGDESGGHGFLLSGWGEALYPRDRHPAPPASTRRAVPGNISPRLSDNRPCTALLLLNFHPFTHSLPA